MMTSLVPPAVVRGMKTLNKELFDSRITVPSLKVQESKICEVVKCLKKYFLKMQHFKAVQQAEISQEGSNCSKDSVKDVFLNPSLVSSWADISAEDREKLASCGITDDLLQKSDIQLKYENWRVDEILKAILPNDKESLTSYSNVGHIVHVNLRDHLLDYKTVIGQVLLDKIKGCETVVNKTNTIDNTYRNFHMEVLSGKADFQTKVKENNCIFEFDFSKVYWNSRLSTEHLRVAKMAKKGDILFDVFAGVGPFAVPCAKNKCTVYANDLNPESYKWLVHNAKLNKIKENFETFNLDGKDFICDIVPKYLYEIYTTEKYTETWNVYFTMNLPAMAVEFLKYFRGILKDYDSNELSYFKPPIVHVYCFVPGDNCMEDARKLVEYNLHCSLNDNLIEIFNVRDVSPNKEMMRVSFYLTKEILFDGNTNNLNKRKRDDCE